jgi:hypothetical protein
MPTVAQLLPLMAEGYEAKCLELKIIQRKREIKTPADLMLLCLFHLINGCSLVDISEIARLTNIADISDVGFMKRFAQSGEWFEWITTQLVTRQLANYTKPSFLEAYRPIAVDASDVVEKGRSGETYRLHYAIDIFSLQSHSYKITKEEIGESLTNFSFAKGDLVMGDRAYGTITGIERCLKCGADYLLRLRTNCFNMFDSDGNKISMLSKIDHLRFDESDEFTGYIHSSRESTIPIRVCVKRKSEEACLKARKQMARKESKKQQIISDTAKKLNEYIIVVTSLPSEVLCADILETYRYRWQVENYFKRLKSIMNFGDLPKKNEKSSLAWLKGKLMIALLMETLISGSFFSLYDTFEGNTQYMA